MLTILKVKDKEAQFKALTEKLNWMQSSGHLEYYFPVVIAYSKMNDNITIQAQNDGYIITILK